MLSSIKAKLSVLRMELRRKRESLKNFKFRNSRNTWKKTHGPFANYEMESSLVVKAQSSTSHSTPINNSNLNLTLLTSTEPESASTSATTVTTTTTSVPIPKLFTTRIVLITCPNDNSSQTPPVRELTSSHSPPPRPSQPPETNQQQHQQHQQQRQSLPQPLQRSSSQPLPFKMTSTDRELLTNIESLHSIYKSSASSTNATQVRTLLSRNKLLLLQVNALTPTSALPLQLQHLARTSLELGALLSIRVQDMDGFVRYVSQLQPFYALPSAYWEVVGEGQKRKVTGLHLLLLLSQGNYLAFHMLLEALEVDIDGDEDSGDEEDEYIKYPVRLERALMEGSYDRVWGETKSSQVPGDEFAVFSKVLVETIRQEIASCSEKAYGSIPLSNAKNLFFLESEGAVVEFAKKRDWSLKDGRIWFPLQDQDLLASEKDILSSSGTVIENALNYARELETIV